MSPNTGRFGRAAVLRRMKLEKVRHFRHTGDEMKRCAQASRAHERLIVLRRARACEFW